MAYGEYRIEPVDVTRSLALGETVRQNRMMEELKNYQIAKAKREDAAETQVGQYLPGVLKGATSAKLSPADQAAYDEAIQRLASVSPTWALKIATLKTQAQQNELINRLREAQILRTEKLTAGGGGGGGGPILEPGGGAPRAAPAAQPRPIFAPPGIPSIGQRADLGSIAPTQMAGADVPPIVPPPSTMAGGLTLSMPAVAGPPAGSGGGQAPPASLPPGGPLSITDDGQVRLNPQAVDAPSGAPVGEVTHEKEGIARGWKRLLHPKTQEPLGREGKVYMQDPQGNRHLVPIDPPEKWRTDPNDPQYQIKSDGKRELIPVPPDPARAPLAAGYEWVDPKDHSQGQRVVKGSNADPEVASRLADAKRRENLRAIPASVVTAMNANIANIKNVDRALIELDAVPGGVGGTTGVIAANVPGGSWVANKLDPEGTRLRAMIADIGSMRIHERSGATVTVSEFPRLAPFIPSPSDNAREVRIKLEGFRQAYMDILREERDYYGEGQMFHPHQSASRMLDTPIPEQLGTAGRRGSAGGGKTGASRTTLPMPDVPRGGAPSSSDIDAEMRRRGLIK